MAKMKEYSKAYIKEAINLALSAVQIYQCKSCGHPVEGGFVCRCGDDSPTIRGQDQSIIEV